jgi:hypothetical protein
LFESRVESRVKSGVKSGVKSRVESIEDKQGIYPDTGGIKASINT